ncbi:MAG: metallophosphoesterase [Actinomycetota bacterium]|nr:metallophosphoesterase [Actinomycetota bacterium]
MLFATDLHASEAVFRKFLNAVAVYEANVAILGGDLTGKRIVPVVMQRDGEFVADFGGHELVARTELELDPILRRIRDAGQYPVQVSLSDYDRLAESKETLDEAFRAACVGQVRDWMERAAERLSPSGVPLYVTGGNDDYFEIERVLDEAPYIVNAEGRLVDLTDEIQMISTGYGNPTPWQCPRDITEDELRDRIEAMAVQLPDARRAVFNLHVPPYASGLDLCPRLDTSTRPPRPLVGEEAPAGSSAVREALTRFQPLLSLHGHIHESPGVCALGRTTAVNPGSEYGEGILHSAVIDLVDGDVLSAQLLTA